MNKDEMYFELMQLQKENIELQEQIQNNQNKINELRSKLKD